MTSDFKDESVPENVFKEGQAIEDRVECLATIISQRDIPPNVISEFYKLIEDSYHLGRVHQDLGDNEHPYSSKFLESLEKSKKGFLG